MSLVLNLPLDAQERLRQKAEQTGLSAEEAVRQASEAVPQPKDSILPWAGLLLLAFLLSQEPPAELIEQVNEAQRALIDDLLANGSEELISALLPKVPAERTWGPIVQAVLNDPNAPPRPAPKPLPDTASASNGLADLFAQWEAEDAALSPEEYAESERQWAAFREGMNAARREVGSEEVI